MARQQRTIIVSAVMRGEAGRRLRRQIELESCEVILDYEKLQSIMKFVEQ